MTRNPFIISFIVLLVFAMTTLCAVAQTSKPAEDEAKPFKPEELEALVAQIALYPDSVLSQVLMASTYPLEVVQAERWADQNKALKGDALTAALEKQNWDPSVKSLIQFPQVLTMMSKQLDWTVKLGDAFIADQKAVMNAVQKLRAKAQAQGNLKDSKEQKVIVEKAPPDVVVVESAPPQVIKIESASPEVIYVPTYNPTVVYGTWPYPYYPPPTPYYPPGYVASNMISFGVGMAVGAAWGYAWGGCNWHGGDVDIDVDRNSNINRNINRESYKSNMQNRQTNRQTGTGAGNRTGTGTGARGNASSFQHDPDHRKGVSYRDQATASKNARPGTSNATQARQDYRGRAEAGRQDISRGGADSFKNNPSVGNRASAGGGMGDTRAPNTARGGGDTPRASQTPSRTGGADRPTPSSSGRSSGGSAFSGSDRSGSSARDSSSRGSSSRSSSPSRSSGGASRGGGGGGGRGGGGGGRR